MNAIIDFLTFLQNFSTVLFFAEILFCWHLPKRKLFWLRLLLFFGVCFLFTRQGSAFTPWKKYELFTSIPWMKIGGKINVGFIIIFFLTALLTWFCFDASFCLILIYCSSGYVVQNLQYHLIETYRYSLFHNETQTLGYRLLACLVIVLLFFLAKLFIVDKNKKCETIVNVKRFSVLYSFFVLIVTVGFSYLSFLSNPADVMPHCYSMMCCMFLLAIEYSFFEKSEADYKSGKIKELYEKKVAMQSSMQVTVDSLNHKAHDLKRYVSAMKLMSEDERTGQLEQLNEIASAYDSLIRTKNQTMDLILTENTMLCAKNEIDFSFMIDCEKLGFVSAEDLYVLLSNALDNAIEAEKKEEPSHRNIYLQAYQNQNFVVLKIENYFSKKLILNDGLPVTSKTDKNEHGFGISSIKQIAEKYGGFLNISVEENRFLLTVVLPVKN